MGANKDALTRLMKQYGGENTNIDLTSPETSSEVPGQIDLSSFIDVSQLDCLNQQADHSVKNIFTQSQHYLESDVDEQLLLSIAFTQPVKLHSIKLIAKDDKKCPKSIKTWVNVLSTPSFDDAESLEPTESLSILSGQIQPLKYVRYQNVHKLVVHLFYYSIFKKN
jgi:hypothetical protein